MNSCRGNAGSFVSHRLCHRRTLNFQHLHFLFKGSCGYNRSSLVHSESTRWLSFLRWDGISGVKWNVSYILSMCRRKWFCPGWAVGCSLFPMLTLGGFGPGCFLHGCLSTSGQFYLWWLIWRLKWHFRPQLEFWGGGKISNSEHTHTQLPGRGRVFQIFPSRALPVGLLLGSDVWELPVYQNIFFQMPTQYLAYTRPWINVYWING